MDIELIKLMKCKLNFILIKIVHLLDAQDFWFP